MNPNEEWAAACAAVDEHLLDCALCDDLKREPCFEASRLLDVVESACKRMSNENKDRTKSSQ